MLILERLGPPIMGDPYRIDTGARVCLETADLFGESLEVGVVEDTESGGVATYSTTVLAVHFRNAREWRPCRNGS